MHSVFQSLTSCKVLSRVCVKLSFGLVRLYFWLYSKCLRGNSMWKFALYLSLLSFCQRPLQMTFFLNEYCSLSICFVFCHRHLFFDVGDSSCFVVVFLILKIRYAICGYFYSLFVSQIVWFLSIAIEFTGCWGFVTLTVRSLWLCSSLALWQITVRV